MSKKDVFKILTERSKKEFKQLEDYLIDSTNDGHLSFVKIEDNRLEFKIGNRRFLISYYFNISKKLRYFKTQEIVINENDYGKFKLVNIDDLDFQSQINTEDDFINSKGERVYLPADYLIRLEDKLEII